MIEPNRNYTRPRLSDTRNLTIPTQASTRPKRNKLLTFLIWIGIALMVWKGLEAFEGMRSANEVKEEPIATLHPIVAAKQAELIEKTSKLGITILITDGLRTSEDQNALYEKGRSKGGSIVTNVKGGHSYHNYGLAIDFALRTKDGDVIWDLEYDGNHNGESDWMEVVAVAKKLGFTWGGDWASFRDYPHLQMDFGYSIRELRRGERPPIENP